MKRVMSASDAPSRRRRWTDMNSEYPERKRNVGAQRWVIHRVKNCAAGSAVPGT